MIPTSSSASTNGCDNISSNCVVWQGPDIACIDLCTGDTISDVTAKLATKVCDLITNGVDANPNLAGLDLTCLNIAGKTPTELVPVLQEMVNSICANTGTGQTPTKSSSLSSTTQTTDSLPIMTLPACLQYNDANGNPVTVLRLDLFASLIANQVCSNLQSIQLINTTLTSYDTRISTLEACVLPCSGVVAEKQVIPTCIINVGKLTDVSVLLLALETRFCALESAVGLPSAINSAITQTDIIGSYATLSTTGTYGSTTGYNNSPSTLAQSMQNAWIVIDDLYDAIVSIQTNCCPTGCDNVTFAYTTSNILDGNGIIDSVNFNFTGSSIPSNFTTPSGYSIITITDVDGSSINTTADVAQLQNNGAGFNVSIPTLNRYADLDITIDFKVSDSSAVCESRETSVIVPNLPCPNIIFTGMTATAGTATWTNIYGVTATLTLDIKDKNTGVVIATYTINNPPSSIVQPFTGLTGATTYEAIVTIQIDGQTKICPATEFVTTSAAAPCTNGMDVAFVIDYSGSMTSIIANVQAGVAGLVNTIDTSSGASNYRLALITADEEQTATPLYSACVDYTNLPSAQKVASLGPNGTWQIVTSWEQFQDNNGTTFTTELNKLAGGVDGTCVQMGDGVGGPEPSDYAAQLVVGGAGLAGSFRNDVAKYIIIITDNLPGGQQDSFNSTVWSGIQNMISVANTQGIKYFVCGPGVNGVGSNPGVVGIYPWKELATQTGGTWNASADANDISADIVAGCS